MVNGVALVTVTADGLSNVRRVDLYVDGVREQADYRGPFLFAWAAFTLPQLPHPAGHPRSHRRHHDPLLAGRPSPHGPTGAGGLAGRIRC